MKPARRPSSPGCFPFTPATPTSAAGRHDQFNPGVAGAAAVLAKVKPIFAGFAPNGFETRTGGTVFTREHGMPANMHPWDFHVLSYPYPCLSSCAI